MSDAPSRLPARPSLEQLRKQAKERLKAMRAAGSGVTLADAQLALAREVGFDSWPKLVHHIESLQSAERFELFERLASDMLAGYSAAPPYYRVDAEHNTIEPRPPLTERDWDAIIAVMEDRRITGIATPAMTDRALERLSKLDFVTCIRMDGARAVSDDGLQALARMPQLEELELGGWYSPHTDRGLEVLRQLKALRRLPLRRRRHAQYRGAAETAHADGAGERRH